MIIISALIFFTVTTVWLYRKRNTLSLSAAFLFAVYTLSLLCAAAMMIIEEWKVNNDAAAYFMLILILFLVPTISVKPISAAGCPSPTWMDPLTPYAWIVGLTGCFSAASNVRSVVWLFSSGQLSEVRKALYDSPASVGVDISISSQLASGIWQVCLVLLVYALICRRSLPLIACLGIGSSSGALVTLAVAGRSGVVYLGMLLIYILVLFRPILLGYRKDLLILARYLALFGISSITLLTLYIAVSRGIGASGTLSVVSNNPFLNSLYSLVIYGGASILNFQDFWFVYDDFGMDLMGKRSFPVFCGILRRLNLIYEYSAERMLTVYKPFYDAYNLEHAVFCGFQRELMMDFGRIGTLVGSIIWAIVGWMFRKRYERRVDLFSVTAMVFFGSVPLLGVFFLSYGELQGNISLLGMVGTIAILGIMQKTNSHTRSSVRSAGVGKMDLPVSSPLRQPDVKPNGN
jgi:hypothetical protein